MGDNIIRANRAVYAWRLFRRGELPARVEVVAVRGTPDRQLADAHAAVREMADDDGTPLTWLAAETVTAVSDDEDVVSELARRDALAHGLAMDELPPGLRNEGL